jgi:hypothetical protein
MAEKKCGCCGGKTKQAEKKASCAPAKKSGK